MLPGVILHNGVSLDGRMDGFSGGMGVYYEIAGRFGAQAMLSGSKTIVERLDDDIIWLKDEMKRLDR